MAAIRILIVDDNHALRANVRLLLAGQAGLQVVGEAADGREAVELAAALLPDVALMDVSMPNLDGIEATRLIKAQHPQIQVLMFTVHQDEGLLQAALHAGASGYAVKQAADTELVDALETVARGERYIHAGLTAAGAPARRGEAVPPAAPTPPAKQLTRLELGVLHLLAQGNSNAQIAAALNLSVPAVERCRTALMTKLGLSSRVQLLNYARENDLM